MEIEGRDSIIAIIVPSSIVGIKAFPVFEARYSEPPKRRNTVTNTALECFIAISREGLKPFKRVFISQDSLSSRIFKINELSTGIRVRERIKELKRANTMLSATGLNNFPSSPSSVKSGINTMMMISTPVTIEGAISRAAL